MMSDIGVRSTQRHCHVTLLPRELLVRIVDYLDSRSRCSLRCTCRMLHAVSNDSGVWRHRVAVMSRVAHYNKRMWAVIGERRLRQLALPTNVALTRGQWSSICEYCPDLERLQVSSRSLLHLDEARARSFYKLSVLELSNDGLFGLVGVPWRLDILPALSYLTLSCMSLTTDSIANILAPLIKLQGITVRASVCVFRLTYLVPFLDQSPALHHLDINGTLLNEKCLLGSAGCKLPERHLQLQSLCLKTVADDFNYLPQLTNLTSLSLRCDRIYWGKLFSAITHLLKLKHLQIKITDHVDWVEILDHLPPLVSFQLDGVRDRTYCGWSESRLKLPSLCTQVAASLKMLSLTSWTLTSSDLQYIGAHLPLLEVLQFRISCEVDFVSQSPLQSLLMLRKLREVSVIAESSCINHPSSGYRIRADPTLDFGQLYTASDHRIRVTHRPDSWPVDPATVIGQ